MKVLELFAGSATFSLVAKQHGHEVFTTDITQYGNIDYVVDILNFDYSKVPFVPDVIWASPPCQGFSVCTIGRNWTPDKKPKTDKAKLGISLLEKTLEIINHYKPKYFFIENPRGMMRTLPILLKLEESNQAIRNTVTYCQYGETRQKPTDIWTNNLKWIPKPVCKPKAPCHESAPRGSYTGVQGQLNAFERSKIPTKLCEDIIKTFKE